MAGEFDFDAVELRERCTKCDRGREKDETGWMQIGGWTDEHGEHHAVAHLCPQCMREEEQAGRT